MIPLKRPSARETEDELIQMQNEFLSRNDQPAAHVVNKRKAEVENDNLMDVSEDHDDSKRLKSKIQDEEKSEASEEKMEFFDNHSIPSTPLFTEILERDTTHLVAVAPTLVTVPFPQVKVRNRKFSGEPGRKSIFAQEMEQMKKQNNKDTTYSKSFLPSISDSSIVVDGTGLDASDQQLEVKRIHEENMEKIAAMSKKEILKCQNELLSHLDPNVVTFLRNKRKQEITSHSPSSKKNPIKVDQVENKLDIEMSELPINPDEAKQKFLHMDKVEKDKLAWMTMLPKPKPIDAKTGYSARFDFEGKLLSRDVDVPTQQGLHHHGDEPELSGYTVEELFLLVRSASHSQRVLALQTLARILKNYWQGLFDECLQTQLLPVLLNAGLVQLLRCALDDNTESVISATVFGIYSLIVCEPDELCLDKVFSWHHGYVGPFLKLPNSPEGDKLDNETNLKELNDAEIVKLDVIKGFLRMDLLPRLRYIIEVCQPKASVIENILQILIRISRHSLEGATKVVNCPRLMTTIINAFLPTNWNVVDVIQNKIASVYGSPLSYAVKLIRVIASAGRNLASCLVSDFHVMKPLSCYLTIDPSDVKLPTPEALKLNLESLRTWRVLLAYGLAAENYLDLFPIIMVQLQFCETLSINTNVEKHIFDYQYAAALLGTMEAVVGVAASNTVLSAERINIEGLNQQIPLHIAWNHVIGLYNIVETCMKKWLWELLAGDTTSSGLTLLASCMDFLATFFKKFSTQPQWNAVDLLEKIEVMYEKYIIALLQSKVFISLLKQLCTHSLLLSSETMGTKRNAETLGCLGSIMWASDVVPLLKEQSPFHFFSSFTNLTSTLISLHHSLKKEVLKKEFIDHQEVMKYTKQVFAQNITSNINWFCRYELHFLYHLATLASYSKSSNIHAFHNLALHLVPLFCKGQDYLLQELLCNVVFQLDFFPEKDDLSWAVKQLQVGDKVSLQSATGQTILVNDWMLLNDSCQQFADIRSSYIENIASLGATKKNRWCIEQTSNLVETLSVGRYTQSVLPFDWVFLHIIQLYSDSKQREPENESSAETVAMVTRSLQWVHLLQAWRSSFMNNILPHVVFCHLSAVFLISGNLFLDKNVQCYLHASLNHLFTMHPSDKMKFDNMQLSGITSLDDLYTELLNHFEGVSYGDNLFANYIMVLFQQTYKSNWKKQLLTEHNGILKIQGIPLSEVIVPLKKYLNPLEEDEELLSLYCKNLLSGHLQQKKNPLLYLMAVHHLHHFLFMELSQNKLQFNLLKNLLNVKDKEVAHHLIYYKNPDENSHLGFSVYNCIPEDRKQLISRFFPGSFENEFR